MTLAGDPEKTNRAFHAIFDALAALFSGGTCPTPSRSIGEIAAGSFVCTTHDGGNMYEISAYVWRDDFDDVGLVADTARAAGASDVVISHVIHDTLNDETGGRTVDGSRAWQISVHIMPDVGR